MSERGSGIIIWIYWKIIGEEFYGEGFEVFCGKG